MKCTTLFAAAVVGLLALASSPPASATGCSPVTNTLSNGSPWTTDGALRITVDGLGSFGSSNGGHATFNPAGPIGPAGTVYSSNLYLSSADALLQDCRNGARAQELSRSPQSLVTRATVGPIRIDVDQRLTPITDSRSTLTQTYTLKNVGRYSVPLALVRHLDGDLRFDDTILDGGAASADGKVLYEFDRSDDAAAPSTFVGITGALDGRETPDRWTIQAFDYRGDIRWANGIRSSDNGVVHNDSNGDRIVDTAFDATLSQQWQVASLAPGHSVTLVTETRFGREPPKNRPPQAVGDSLTTDEDTPASVDVLANDADPDGDAISLVESTDGAHGSVSCAGGLCTYTPAANFNGADSFTYTVSDTHGATSSADVDVSVTPVDEPRQTLTVTRIGNARITSSPAGIDCGSVCSAEFELGTVVTLTATPDPGWSFAGWSGACAGSTSCVVTVDTGKAVTASFALPPPTPTQNVNVTPVAGEVLVKLPGSHPVRASDRTEPGADGVADRRNARPRRADRRPRRRKHRRLGLLRRRLRAQPARARRSSSSYGSSSGTSASARSRRCSPLPRTHARSGASGGPARASTGRAASTARRRCEGRSGRPRTAATGRSRRSRRGP